MPEPLLQMASWIVHYLLHSTLLLGAAWLIDRVALVRSPVIREHLWRAALVGALVTATAQSAGLVEAGPRALLNVDPAPLLATAPPSTLVSQENRSSMLTKGGAPSDRTVDGVAAATQPAAATPLAKQARSGLSRLAVTLIRSWPAALVWLWLGGAIVASLRLLAMAWLARQELAGRMPADAMIASELSNLCVAQGIAAPALTTTASIPGPISLPNGEIVLPPWALGVLDLRQRRALLAHELGHQVRHDPQWLAFLLALDAVLWIQPLHRLARRRLSRLAELEADSWAVRAGNEPRALAECLAECAERLQTHRIARFSAAMTTVETRESPLLHRIERLMNGAPMPTSQISWPLRGAVAVALVGALFVLPGCGIDSLRATGNNFSSETSVSADGDVTVSVTRPGYSLRLESEGEVTFHDDESDVAALEANGEFELTERLHGVKQTYRVTADRSGNLVRSYWRAGASQEMDDDARRWLSEALPRMFRESGFDAEARVARLIAAGGPSRVLAEIELAGSDFAKGSYLGYLLASTKLAPAEVDRALVAIDRIDSDFERRQALGKAMDSQQLDGPLAARLLEVAGGIDSGFELSELLMAAMKELPDDPAARDAWIAAARKVDGSFELGRCLGIAIERSAGDASFTARLLTLATERMDSSFELGQVLHLAAGRAGDPAVASAYLAAVQEMDGSFERKTALLDLLSASRLDATGLAGALEATAAIGSDFEKREVLEALARSVASDPALHRRYREIARGMSDFERGQALRALDDAESHGA